MGMMDVGVCGFFWVVGTALVLLMGVYYDLFWGLTAFLALLWQIVSIGLVKWL